MKHYRFLLLEQNELDLAKYKRTIEDIHVAELMNPSKVFENLGGQNLIDKVFPIIIPGVTYASFLVCAKNNRWPSNKYLNKNYGKNKGPRAAATRNYYERMWNKIKENPDSIIYKYFSKKTNWENTDENNWKNALLDSIPDRNSRSLFETVINKKHNSFSDFCVSILKEGDSNNKLWKLTFCFTMMRLLYGDGASVVREGSYDAKRFLNDKNKVHDLLVYLSKKTKDDYHIKLFSKFKNNKASPPFASVTIKYAKEGHRVLKGLRLWTFYKLYTRPYIDRLK